MLLKLIVFRVTRAVCQESFNLGGNIDSKLCWDYRSTLGHNLSSRVHFEAGIHSHYCRSILQSEAILCDPCNLTVKHLVKSCLRLHALGLQLLVQLLLFDQDVLSAEVALHVDRRQQSLVRDGAHAHVGRLAVSSKLHALDDVAVAVLLLGDEAQHDLGALLGRHVHVLRAHLADAVLGLDGGGVGGGRAHAGDADAQARLELRQRQREGRQCALGCVVQRRADRRQVRAHRGHEQQAACDLVLQPVVDGDLREPNGTHLVHREEVVESGGSVGVILRQWRDTRGMPEGGVWRLPVVVNG